MTSLVYFMHGGKWHVVPDQEINVNAVMRNLIEFDSGQDILEGALVYRIRRKHAETDKSAQDKSKNVQLLVAWRVEHTKELDVRLVLVEHDGELDKDKLKKLYQKYWHLLTAQVKLKENKWLLSDATTLKTTAKIMKGGCRWNIFISETTGYEIKKPLWIDEER
jgi:hypothetical protein